MNRMNSTNGLPVWVTYESIFILQPARTQLQISMDALGQNETLDRRCVKCDTSQPWAVLIGFISLGQDGTCQVFWLKVFILQPEDCVLSHGR